MGVEIVKSRWWLTRKMLKEAASKLRIYRRDVLKVLDEIEEKPDFIVLDPAWDGIHPKALPKIIEYQVDNLVYISCKPTSLARDLEIFFTKRGYRAWRRCVCVVIRGLHRQVHTENPKSHETYNTSQ